MGFFDNLLREPRHPDEVRMTLGEHLEELRSRLVRAMVALVVGAAVCLGFKDYIVAFLCAPMFAALARHGLDTRLVALSPMEEFITDLKVSLILGFIITAPYSLAQIWGFIAAGLYPHERKWVRSFVPVSIGLFFAGAVFFQIFVMPMMLNFFVGYRAELPGVGNYASWFLPGPSAALVLPATSRPAEWQAADRPPASMPAFQDDPADAPEGTAWVNLKAGELRMRLGDKIFTVARLKESGQHPRVEQQPRLTEYVLFTLQMAASFGIGFQVPVIVAFLAAVGIARAADMARFRRHVYFGMAIAAAVITPSPDPGSMLALLGPMALLFEAGLWAARAIEARRGEATN